MRPVGVFYATREGQTRKIAERIVTVLRAAGFDARAQDVRTASANIEWPEFDASILAASVRAGAHEAEMVRFVKNHRERLEAMPTAFISVSLSQVGAEDQTRSVSDRASFAADVNKTIARFLDATGWKPGQVKPVAGALPYSRYNFLIRYVMKRIARNNGAPTDTSRDYEFTDWADLDAFVGKFAQELTVATASPAGPR